jgi:hypothetical protein
MCKKVKVLYELSADRCIGISSCGTFATLFRLSVPSRSGGRPPVKFCRAITNAQVGRNHLVHRRGKPALRSDKVVYLWEVHGESLKNEEVEELLWRGIRLARVRRILFIVCLKENFLFLRDKKWKFNP